jgi:hypothetical protein
MKVKKNVVLYDELMKKQLLRGMNYDENNGRVECPLPRPHTLKL